MASNLNKEGNLNQVTLGYLSYENVRDHFLTSVFLDLYKQYLTKRSIDSLKKTWVNTSHSIHTVKGQDLRGTVLEEIIKEIYNLFNHYVGIHFSINRMY